MASIQNREDSDVWHKKHEARTPRVGDVAPDFELSDVEGESQIRLSDFAGRKPVALVFGKLYVTAVRSRGGRPQRYLLRVPPGSRVSRDLHT